MQKRERNIADKLGASRTFKVRTKAIGPLALLQLYEEVTTRLESKGGRPTDPHWDFRRQVPFQKETWKILNEMAQALRDENARIGPGQIAAILVEHQLEILNVKAQKGSRQTFESLVRRKLDAEKGIAEKKKKAA